MRNLLVSAWKRYKNKRSEDKQEDRKAESKEGDGSLHNGSSGKESPPVSGPPCPSRKSLISAANCGAQDQIKTLLADPSIDVNEQSAKGILLISKNTKVPNGIFILLIASKMFFFLFEFKGIFCVTLRCRPG